MKVSKEFPWFELVAFLLVVLFAVGSNAPHNRAAAASDRTTQAPPANSPPAGS